MEKVTKLSNVKIVNGFLTKSFGLLRQPKGQQIFFQTRFGIHTFFLKFPIDVLILNDKLQIINYKTIFPNKVFFWNPKYFNVLELPSGSIQKLHLKRGDYLKLN